MKKENNMKTALQILSAINPDYLIYGEKNDVGDSH